MQTHLLLAECPGFAYMPAAYVLLSTPAVTPLPVRLISRGSIFLLLFRGLGSCFVTLLIRCIHAVLPARLVWAACSKSKATIDLDGTPYHGNYAVIVPKFAIHGT